MDADRCTIPDQEEHHLRNPNRVLAVKSIGSIRMEIFRSHLCKKSRAFGKTKQVRSLNHLKINEKERKGEAVSLRSESVHSPGYNMFHREGSFIH
jgi:hypothetical protein